MALSEDQLKKVQNWLTSKAPSLECPVCEKKSFVVEGPAIANEYTPGTISMGGGIPLVYVICSNCGNTMPFAAKMLDVV